MIIIDVKTEKNLDSALRLLKQKVQKIKQNQELKDRKEFEKQSVRKRKLKQKAIYTLKIKNGL